MSRKLNLKDLQVKTPSQRIQSPDTPLESASKALQVVEQPTSTTPKKPGRPSKGPKTRHNIALPHKEQVLFEEIIDTTFDLRLRLSNNDLFRLAIHALKSLDEEEFKEHALRLEPTR
ncbi:MAG: hypothetical protein VYA34_03365 [Myxococcota bacterium]|nr:hypothetical protein [Myxococcota bacterium]